jgi:hypothetical protein
MIHSDSSDVNIKLTMHNLSTESTKVCPSIFSPGCSVSTAILWLLYPSTWGRSPSFWPMPTPSCGLQVSRFAVEDWATINLPLYAWFFTAQSRWRNSCRHCSGQDHPTHQCPWGVDVACPMATEITTRSEVPICLSWNAGACRFPAACNFRHICSTCLGPH